MISPEFEQHIIKWVNTPDEVHIRRIVEIYKDKGVTPFTMRCTRCGGTMYHTKTFDKKTVPPYVMVFDWYRPTLEQTLKMSDGMIDHILNGGLILDSEKW